MNCICAGLRWVGVAGGYCAAGGMGRGDGAASSCMKDSIARIRSSLGPGRFIAAAIKSYKKIYYYSQLFFAGDFFSKKRKNKSPSS
jgi:hypothetical protein